MPLLLVHRSFITLGQNATLPILHKPALNSCLFFAFALQYYVWNLTHPHTKVSAYTNAQMRLGVYLYAYKHVIGHRGSIHKDTGRLHKLFMTTDINLHGHLQRLISTIGKFQNG